MNEIELKKLYDRLRSKLNIGTFEYFKSKMSDTESRKRFYNKFYKKLYRRKFDLGKYEDYERRLSGGSSSSTPQIIITLPSWAKCIGTTLASVFTTTDENDELIVGTTFGKDNGYFWKDNTFNYVTTNGKNINGEWSCDNDYLTIKTDDGLQWTKKTQWTNKVSKDIGTQATGGSLDKITVDPSKLPPDSESEEQNESFEKNKSKMKNLETVIEEIDNLITKTNLKEQASQSKIPDAPLDEITILYNNAVLRNYGGAVVPLCERNGNSVPVIVGGRQYFAGRVVTLNSGGTTGRVVYDGRILVKESDSGCSYRLYPSNNKFLRLDGFKVEMLQPKFNELLKKFNINNMDVESNPYAYIRYMTQKFQQILNDGGKSKFFGQWQELLKNYFPYNNVERLQFKDESSFQDPYQDEISKYDPVTANYLGVKFNDNTVRIYIPKGKLRDYKQDTISKQIGGQTGECRTMLFNYLIAAFEYQQTKQEDGRIQQAEYRTKLRNCKTTGAYDNMVPITQQDLENAVSFSKKNNPFKGFLNLRGTSLTFKEIARLLSGETNKLPRVSGTAGPNPYLPLDFPDVNESLLKNRIDNILLEMYEEKTKLKTEKRIIQTRTNLLLENRILKFTEPRERFFNELISELSYLEKQKFNKKLIKEEFWGKIKGLFGDNGSEAIFGTFKEYMSKWLVEKLTTVNPNGWVGIAIKKSVKDIRVDDIDKLTDCDFMTKRISTSITDEILNKMKNDQQIDGGISKIVKGGLTKSIDRTELLRSIEEGVSDIICPELGNVDKKLKDKAEEMKSKAIKP